MPGVRDAYLYRGSEAEESKPQHERNWAVAPFSEQQNSKPTLMRLALVVKRKCRQILAITEQCGAGNRLLRNENVASAVRKYVKRTVTYRDRLLVKRTVTQPDRFLVKRTMTHRDRLLVTCGATPRRCTFWNRKEHFEPGGSRWRQLRDMCIETEEGLEDVVIGERTHLASMGR